MLDKAIEKINEEMKKSKNLSIKAIGSYLLEQISINKNVAEKILQGSKTIAGSLKEIEKVARKRQVAGVAILTDAEGFKIVREYFGFEAVQDKILDIKVSEIKENYKAEEKNSNVSFKVDLKDLLNR